MKLELKINARIEVLYEELTYKSIIQDINKIEIVIAIPVRDGIYLTMSTGEEIEQYYYDEKGNLFKYRSKIRGRKVENGMSFYTLSLPNHIEKIQRRDYVRVDILNQISYIIAKNIEESNIRKALIIDLSGGGCKIKVKDKLNKDEIILIKLDLEGINLSVKGKIIRADLTEDKSYICGVCFFDLEEPLKEKIIKLVFAIMRKQRELL